ncbi:hypothetical protein GGP41_004464 [Bipolaris sorokiniana]|uniref:Uncharacterized protein n=2 Tax=Cochliobolus sativus TaxID=45130 RepID=A0A8H5ZM73_COCSA|nr:uncharacterized protein COCSADRAFT_175355 [Bipolaris sorokiniana ND90Pr]EMD59494.1 hypothetical protein COCSADRAFT_175355 [Bipolaris sorokiniana ND90Pr]KAF5851635.1 hypothetical protein GGP41_004464 [Bipolaris sorokiniana]
MESRFEKDAPATAEPSATINAPTALTTKPTASSTGSSLTNGQCDIGRTTYTYIHTCIHKYWSATATARFALGPGSVTAAREKAGVVARPTTAKPAISPHLTPELLPLTTSLPMLNTEAMERPARALVSVAVVQQSGSCGVAAAHCDAQRGRQAAFCDCSAGSLVHKQVGCFYLLLIIVNPVTF